MREVGHVVSTTSGQILDELPLVPGTTWRTVLNGIGSGTVKLRLRDSGRGRGYWRDLLRPQDRTIVISYTEGDTDPAQAVYAGRVLLGDYDYTTGVLAVRTEEIRGVLRKRLPFTVPNYAAGDFTLTNVSLWTAARTILKRGLLDGDARWRIPLNLLDAHFPGSYSITWRRWQFVTIEKMLTTVQDLPDGPDIHLRPAWDTDRLRWDGRIGFPRLGMTEEEAHSFDIALDSPESSIRALRYREDGARLLTGVHMLGEGSEDAMKRGSAHRGTGTYLYLDDVQDNKNEANQTVLNGLAQSWLTTHATPTRQYDMTLSADGWPNVRGIIPGSRIRLHTEGDEWLSPGHTELYVIGMSGGGDTYKLETQPI